MIGGSIGAWARGSFSGFLSKVCANAEIKNRSKTGYGAFQLKRRFTAQFLKNWNVKLKDERFEYWLVYSGGLNSIATPEMTVKYTVDTFVRAHRKGVKVVGLTLTPWGDEADKRWRDWKGLRRLLNTKKYVDYMLGRLTRAEALGRYANDGQTEWREGELPDVAVDLFDSDLRDRDAGARDIARATRRYDRSRRLEAEYPERDEALRQVAEVPKWYLRKSLRSFDHIHPNTDGHKVIAKTVCPKLPRSWGCACDALDSWRWERGRGLVQGAP